MYTIEEKKFHAFPLRFALMVTSLCLLKFRRWYTAWFCIIRLTIFSAVIVFPVQIRIGNQIQQNILIKIMIFIINFASQTICTGINCDEFTHSLWNGVWIFKTIFEWHMRLTMANDVNIKIVHELFSNRIWRTNYDFVHVLKFVKSNYVDYCHINVIYFGLAAHLGSPCMQVHLVHVREDSWLDNSDLCICSQSDQYASLQSNSRPICEPVQENPNVRHGINQMRHRHTPEPFEKQKKLIKNLWDNFKIIKNLVKFPYNFIRRFWWFSITELCDLLCGRPKLATSSPGWSCLMI